jgi:hypothetical protein
VFGHSNGVTAGTVPDFNAKGTGSADIDIVETGPGAANDPQPEAIFDSLAAQTSGVIYDNAMITADYLLEFFFSNIFSDINIDRIMEYVQSLLVNGRAYKHPGFSSRRS